MDISVLRRTAYNKSLDYKAISRLVSSEAFERAWERMTQAQRADCVKQAEVGAANNIRRIVRDALVDSIEDKSLRQLREIAKSRGVDYYHHKSKSELIEELGDDDELGASNRRRDAPDSNTGGHHKS